MEQKRLGARQTQDQTGKNRVAGASRTSLNGLGVSESLGPAGGQLALSRLKSVGFYSLTV